MLLHQGKGKGGSEEEGTRREAEEGEREGGRVEEVGGAGERGKEGWRDGGGTR